MSVTARNAVLLALLGLALTGAAALVAASPDPKGPGYVRFLGAYLTAWTVYACAVGLAFGRRVEGRAAFAVCFVTAVVVRAVMLAAPANDDPSRYVWEGRIQLEGWNPYAVAPADPRLDYLDDDVRRNVPFPRWTTLYGPVAMMAYAAVNLVGSTVFVMKVFLAVADVCVVVLVALLLRARGLPGVRSVVYAWCPLVVWSFAGRGQGDVLHIALVVGALLALDRGRPYAGAAIAGLAAAAKVAGGVAMLAILRRLKARHVALGALVFVLVHVPYAGAGRGLVSGIAAFEATAFNGPVFVLVSDVLGLPVLARPAGAVLLLATVVWVWARNYEPALGALWISGVLIVASPVVQPWYVTWVVPLVCLRFSPAWFALTGSVIFYYAAYFLSESGAGRPAVLAAQSAEYLPFIVVAAVTFAVSRRMRRRLSAGCSGAGAGR
jgi:hypothetical protein